MLTVRRMSAWPLHLPLLFPGQLQSAKPCSLKQVQFPGLHTLIRVMVARGFPLLMSKEGLKRFKRDEQLCPKDGDCQTVRLLFSKIVIFGIELGQVWEIRQSMAIFLQHSCIQSARPVICTLSEVISLFLAHERNSNSSILTTFFHIQKNNQNKKP